MSESIEVLGGGDILEGLQDDPDGQLREAVVARIKEKAVEIKRNLDRGASPDEYQILSKALAALEVAPTVVSKAWVMFQKLNAKQ